MPQIGKAIVTATPFVFCATEDHVNWRNLSKRLASWKLLTQNTFERRIPRVGVHYVYSRVSVLYHVCIRVEAGRVDQTHSRYTGNFPKNGCVIVFFLTDYSLLLLQLITTWVAKYFARDTLDEIDSITNVVKWFACESRTLQKLFAINLLRV